MKSPRVAIVVDQPQRDLAGVVLTAMELARSGAVCHLVPGNLKKWEIWSLAPDFVLMFCLRRGYERFIEQMVAAGVGFGLMDTEGGVWPNPEEYGALLVAPSLLHQAAVACMWGQGLSRYALGAGLLREDQVRITGCPRFDFYHPAWRSVLKDGASTNGHKRILINTLYTEANPRFGTHEKMHEHMTKLFGWSEERAQWSLDTERRAIALILEMVRALSRDFPEAALVLRPHPFEGVELYRDQLAGIPNLEINDSGPVQSQLFRASVVIQRSCTTAVEAGLASVPTLSPRWVPAVYEMPMAEAVSVPCADYDALRSTVSDVLSGTHQASPRVREDLAKVVGEWFHRIDGESYRRVSDAILASLPEHRRVDRRACERILYGVDGGTESVGARTTSRVRLALGLSPFFSFTRLRDDITDEGWSQSGLFFGVEDVQTLVEKIASAKRERGGAVRPMRVELARDRGEQTRGYPGHSVTLALD